MARKKKTIEAAVDANAPYVVPERSAGPVRPEARSTMLIGCGLIRRSPANPRVIREDDPTIRELATSIYCEGQQEPGLVRPIPGRPQHPDGNGPLFELVFGERRWRACALAGVPYECFVRDDLDDAEAHELTVLENLQRENLSPLEEADGVRTLVETGKDMAMIADDLGKPLSWVYRRARIGHLSDLWRGALADPDSVFAGWSATHLELIARFDGPVQDEIYASLEQHWDIRSRTVKEIRNLLDRWMLVLSSAPWNIDEVVEGDGVTYLTCRECDKRSSVQPHLFDDEETSGGKRDRCLDRECFRKKFGASIAQRYEAAVLAHGKGLRLIEGKEGNGSMLDGGHPLRKRPILEGWTYEKCKAGNKEAVPAFVIDGAGAGTVVWITIRGQYEKSPAAVERDADGNRLPAPLAERRKQLDARREKAVIERIKNWLDADLIESAKVLTPQESSKSQYSIMALAMASMHASLEFTRVSDEGYWQLYDQYVAEIENDCSAATSRIYRMAYKMHPMMSIASRLQNTLDRVDGTFARRMAEFHGLDVEAFDAAARKEIKEPKAWANLNEDGTPKKRGA